MAAPLSTRAIRWTALVLCLIAALALKPVVAPLVLGIWAARLLRPWRDALARRPGGRSVVAAVFTLGVLAAVLGVVGFVYLHVAEAGFSLAKSVASAGGPKDALVALVSDGAPRPGPEELRAWLQQHAEQGGQAAKYGLLLGLGTVLFLFFLALATFAALVDGERLLGWARFHAPIRGDHFDRLAAAFSETGRGLFTSVGLTCFTQGVLCTAVFLALGVPRPLVLGLLCALFAVLPVVGTPVVWLPVAAGLWLDDHPAKAILMLVLGGAVIGVIEFLVGPSLAKLGRFKLAPPLILLSMFAGTLGLGPAGLFLGPLVFRLAQEALACMSELPDDGPRLRRGPRVEGSLTARPLETATPRISSR